MFQQPLNFIMTLSLALAMITGCSPSESQEKGLVSDRASGPKSQTGVSPTLQPGHKTGSKAPPPSAGPKRGLSDPGDGTSLPTSPPRWGVKGTEGQHYIVKPLPEGTPGAEDEHAIRAGRPGHIWIRGHWHWLKTTLRYDWMKGRWESIRLGHRWIAGRYSWKIMDKYKVRVWIAGKWQRS